MSKKTVKDILTEARGMIADPSNWTTTYLKKEKTEGGLQQS